MLIKVHNLVLEQKLVRTGLHFQKEHIKKKDKVYYLLLFTRRNHLEEEKTFEAKIRLIILKFYQVPFFRLINAPSLFTHVMSLELGS